MGMFGRSKSSDVGGDHRTQKTQHLTGLERAKLERSVSPGSPHLAVPPRPMENPIHETPPDSPMASAPLAHAARPAPRPDARPVNIPSGEAQLYAGPGIKLKGEITGCDTLRIEGDVDGKVVARHLILCGSGTFLGTAEIDEAEIEGHFDGTLQVHGRLFVRSTGRASGTLSYGEIEVERGGKVMGDIAPEEKQGASKQYSAPRNDGRPAHAVKPPAHRPAPVAPEQAVTMTLPKLNSASKAPDVDAKTRKILFFGRK